MAVCFVIQPFDSGKFDKRFDSVFTPAIEAAGLDSYRVDRDPGVDVPIDSIEQGIKGAVVCLADITTDNPNVWYELGYAFASSTPVVMVCSDERHDRRYPFDIQHRTIIPYKAEAPQDFEVLRAAITRRIKAILKRDIFIQQIQRIDPVAQVEGLSQAELVVLATIAGNISFPENGVSAYTVKNDVEKTGFTALGFSLGLRRLISKKLVHLREATDYSGEPYQEVIVSDVGWEWIERNEEKFVLKRADPFDDVPF